MTANFRSATTAMTREALHRAGIIVANGYECYECGGIYDTGELPEVQADQPMCERCMAEGRGPWLTAPVRIESCPNTGFDCDDGEHHWGRGDHVYSLRGS